MGAWGYKVLENDAVLDVLYNINKKNLNKEQIFRYVESQLKYRVECHEKEIILAMALVDVSVNGIDQKILGGHSDSYYGYKDFLENDLPDLISLIDDAIHAGQDLLLFENKSGWNNPFLRKSVIEHIILKLLLYKNGLNANDFDLSDIKNLQNMELAHTVDYENKKEN